MKEGSMEKLMVDRSVKISIFQDSNTIYTPFKCLKISTTAIVGGMAAFEQLESARRDCTAISSGECCRALALEISEFARAPESENNAAGVGLCIRASDEDDIPMTEVSWSKMAGRRCPWWDESCSCKGLRD